MKSPFPSPLQLIAVGLLSWTLVGCSTSQGTDDARVVIGTFNMEWLGDGKQDRLPRTDQDYLMVADVIIKSGADVFAVQEVENDEALKKVLRYLDGYAGMLSSGGGQQRVGVVYRSSISVKRVGDYTPLQLDRPERLRPGLLVECRKGAFQWLMMSVHLKSSSKYDSTPALLEESREIRSKQAAIAKAFVDSVVSSGKERDVIIAGDFNDYPGRRSNATLDALLDGKLVFLTNGLKSCANPKWNVIDHILASPQAAARFVSGTARVENHNEYLSAQDASKVSDHCPVLVSLDVVAPDPDVAAVR